MIIPLLPARRIPLEHTAQICIQISGYAQAVLALWILLRCALSMLQEKYEPEVWAYLELPGGSSRAIHHWECILGRSHASDIVLAGQAAWTGAMPPSGGMTTASGPCGI